MPPAPISRSIAGPWSQRAATPSPARRGTAVAVVAVMPAIVSRGDSADLFASPVRVERAEQGASASRARRTQVLHLALELRDPRGDRGVGPERAAQSLVDEAPQPG